MSVTDDSNILEISYQISSPKIELSVLQNNREVASVKTTIDQYHFGDSNIQSFPWNSKFFVLDSDVDAVRLVARKTGVTKNAEYVIVNAIEVYSDITGGNGTVTPQA